MVLVQHSLSASSIIKTAKAENAAAVIAQLAERLSKQLGVEAETITDAVLERESTRTTAFANGAAIPHCRLVGLRQFATAIMILEHPVRWDNEGHAVDTVIMIAGPSGNVADHLRLMANSSQLVDSTALRNKLKRAPDVEAAHALIVEAEKAIEKRRSRDGLLRELRGDQNGSEPVDHLAAVADKFDW